MDKRPCNYSPITYLLGEKQQEAGKKRQEKPGLLVIYQREANQGDEHREKQQVVTPR